MKSLLKAALAHLGYELRRAAPPLPEGHTAFAEQQRLLQSCAAPRICDVGAHHGQTTRRYKELFPTATVYSFEPFAASFAELQRTTAQLTNVHPINRALSDRVGKTVFHSNTQSPTNSLLPTAAAAATTWPGCVETVGQVQVPTTTLDEFCRERAIATIDLLKLDVQGAEPLVLKGAQNLLQRGRVRLVYIEIMTLPVYVGQLELPELLSMLRGYGLALWNFYNPSVTPAGQLRQVDAIFIAKEGGDAPQS